MIRQRAASTKQTALHASRRLDDRPPIALCARISYRLQHDPLLMAGIFCGIQSVLKRCEQKLTYGDKHPFTLPFTPTGSLESPVHLHVFGLWEEVGVTWRKPGERSYPRLGIKPRTCEATVLPKNNNNNNLADTKTKTSWFLKFLCASKHIDVIIES